MVFTLSSPKVICKIIKILWQKSHTSRFPSGSNLHTKNVQSESVHEELDGIANYTIMQLEKNDGNRRSSGRMRSRIQIIDSRCECDKEITAEEEKVLLWCVKCVVVKQFGCVQLLLISHVEIDANLNSFTPLVWITSLFLAIGHVTVVNLMWWSVAVSGHEYNVFVS